MFLSEGNNKLKILITGAAGFIGFHLSKRLLKEGNTILGIDEINDYYDITLKQLRLVQLNQYSNFIFKKLDIAEEHELNDVFQKFEPEIVINLAAQAGVRYSIENPKAYIRSNLIGFANVLEACRSYPVKHLIFASSSSVYGANQKLPFSEDDKTDQPVSLYAATKKSNELLAYSYSHLYQIPMTGLRFFTVYGPYGRPDMAYFSFAQAISAKKEIKVFNYGDMYRDFTYVDDVVESVVRLLDQSRALKQSPPFEVYNIGNNHPEKLEYFIDCLEKSLGEKAIKKYLPIQQGDVYRTYADIDKLQTDTGFHPSTTLEDGINQFALWFKDWKH